MAFSTAGWTYFCVQSVDQGGERLVGRDGADEAEQALGHRRAGPVVEEPHQRARRCRAEVGDDGPDLLGPVQHVPGFDRGQHGVDVGRVGRRGQQHHPQFLRDVGAGERGGVLVDPGLLGRDQVAGRQPGRAASRPAGPRGAATVSA